MHLEQRSAPEGQYYDIEYSPEQGLNKDLSSTPTTANRHNCPLDSPLYFRCEEWLRIWGEGRGGEHRERDDDGSERALRSFHSQDGHHQAVGMVPGGWCGTVGLR